MYCEAYVFVGPALKWGLFAGARRERGDSKTWRITSTE